MDIRKVKKLIHLLQESGLSEIEIHEGKDSVRISNHHSAQTQHPLIQGTPPTIIDTSASTATQSYTTETTDTPANDRHIIKSPMVGIFYAAASPDTPEFAKVAQKVNKGDILCIIEAMKIMNQIESDVSGVIQRIFVENGETVEYGQPLFEFQ